MHLSSLPITPLQFLVLCVNQEFINLFIYSSTGIPLLFYVCMLCINGMHVWSVLFSMYVEATGQPRLLFLRHRPPCVVRQEFSKKARLADHRAHGATCFLLPTDRITCVCLHA